MHDPFAFLTPKEADRRAEQWLKTNDSKPMVGSRHHIVPRFHLQRFADRHDQLVVRDRATGKVTRRAVRDLAVTDFYTAINVSGELDSSLESILGVIETEAAVVIRNHLDLGAFARPRPFNDVERLTLDTYVAAQHARGMRTRRTAELIADYGTKLVNQHLLSDQDLGELEFIPHQNDHLIAFDRHLPGGYERLQDRPLCLVTLDAPSLLIGDEPVVFPLPDGWEDQPAPGPETYPSVRAEGIQPRDFIQFQSQRGRPALDITDEVALPLSPTSFLVYGHRGSRRPEPPARLSGAGARKVASELNELIIDNAVDWVAAHPGHTSFTTMHWPAPSPLLRVIDGGSVMGRQASESERRRPHRLRKDRTAS